MECGVDRQGGVTSAGMKALYWTIVVKRWAEPEGCCDPAPDERQKMDEWDFYCKESLEHIDDQRVRVRYFLVT